MTEPKRILVPLDFSTPATRALEYARTIGAQFGARLFLLHVVDDEAYIPLYHLPFVSSEEFRRHTDEAVQKRIREEATGDEEPVVAHGAPAAVICAKAEEMDIDLIVMSTHGRRGLERAFLGSVAAKVVRGAHCPVLSVKESKNG